MDNQSRRPESVPSRNAIERKLLSRRNDRTGGAAECRLEPQQMAGPTPLSFAQERLWLAEQLAPGKSNNFAFRFRLRGRLSRASLDLSISDLSARHDILRTIVDAGGDAPTQVVLPKMGSGSIYLDLSRDPDPPAAADRFVRATTAEPFDLATAAPIRWHLIKLAEDDHILLFCMHHIAGDGWSDAVLRRDLTALYSAHCSGLPPALPELPVQYSDFAVWDRAKEGTPSFRAELAYWRERLTGAPSAIALPFDRAPSDSDIPRGAFLCSPLPASAIARMKEQCRSAEVTPFMFLLTVFAILLARYSGQDDLLIGTPVAGRGDPRLENLIGCFINLIPLRISVSGDLSLRSLVRRVRDTFLNDYMRQSVPLERVIQEVRPAREPGRNPLVQVLFQVDNTPSEEMELRGLEVTAEQVFTDRSPAELTLIIEERSDGIMGYWQYRADLFESTTVRRMQEHYARLLETLTADPDQPVTRARVTVRERQTLREGASQATPARRPFHQTFEAQARRVPARAALTAGQEAVTFADLNGRANQFARRLRELGAGPDELVAVSLELSPDLIAIMIAAHKAGGAYLPLDPKTPAARLRRMLDDAAPRIVVTKDSRIPQLGHRPVSAVTIEQLARESEGYAATDLCLDIHPDQLAYVIYTSGSTGNPKGVAVTHRGLANYIQWAVGLLSPEASHGSVVHSSLCFDLALTSLFPALSAGQGVIILPEERDGAVVGRLARLLTADDRGIGLVKLTPSHLSALEMSLESGEHAEAASTLVVGGEALPAGLVAAWRLRAPRTRILNHYGPTETTIGCLTYEIPADHDPALPVPIGRPIENTTAYVVDARGALAMPGVTGELYVGGAGLARGYLNRPTLTAERFVPDPFGGEPGGRLYRTGDLVRYRDDDTVEFIGRTDQQLKIRGYRVEPGEIEACLRRDPRVSAAAVTMRDDQLVAYYVTVGECTPQPADLRLELSRQLPDYMVPAVFVPLPELPMTANGKLDRKALPVPGSSRPGPGRTAFNGPRTPAEESLAEIWRDLLHVDRVAVDDDFFDLGGNSMLAIQAAVRIRRVFPAIALQTIARNLLRHRTIVSLASVMGQALLDQARMPVTPPAPDAVAPGTSTAGDTVAVSLAQQGVWLLDRMRGDNSGHVIAAALRVSGELDVPALRAALTDLLARHEALRTTVSPGAEGPEGHVQPPGPFPLDVRRADPPDRSSAELPRLIAELAATPIDPGIVPLIRGTLLTLGPNEHLLVLAVHHIAWDAWSARIFLGELAESYTARLAGHPAALPPLDVSYADLAARQRAQLDGGRWTLGRIYWRRALAGLPSFELTDAGERSGKAAIRRFMVPSGLAERLETLGRDEGGTLFMGLLAALQALLFSRTGQSSIPVGTTVSGRSEAGADRIVGLFVNLLVLRGDLSGNPSFRELLRRTRDVTIDAFAHQEVPFEVVSADAQGERDRTPLFRALIDFDPSPPRELTIPGLVVSDVLAESQVAKHDIALAFRRAADIGLLGEFTFDAGLIPEVTADDIAADYGRLLASVAEHPDAAIASLAGGSQWAAADPLSTPVPSHQARQPAETPRPAAVEYIAPRTDTQRVLADLWAQDIGVTQVGLHDNFFRIGGHSLIAMRTVARMHATFGTELPLSVIFESRNLEEAADQVEQIIRNGIESTGETPVSETLSPPG